MKRNKRILCLAGFLVFFLWIFQLNTKTGFIGSWREEIAAGLIESKLAHLEHSAPARKKLETTLLKRMRAVKVTGEDRCDYCKMEIDEYRKQFPGLQRIRYYKGDVSYFDILYDEENRMVRYFTCF